MRCPDSGVCAGSVEYDVALPVLVASGPLDLRITEAVRHGCLGESGWAGDDVNGMPDLS